MDCNKEEATRAINLAEEKMKGGDFVGAHKLIMKAQRLFPELENVQKLLAVCAVHSSADKKIKGLDDWYGILQVQPSADFDTIKKQYRKLCLLLHPDKNKFPGAEAAFKLVGEANRLLSDQSKRSQYDVRYRSHSLFASKESNANANSLRNSSSANAAAVNIASGLTFWTCCRSCGHRYKYLKVYMNQLMHCSSCKKSYTACNIGSDGVSFSGSTAGVKQFQDQGIPRQHPSTGAESGSSAAEMDQNGTVGGKLNRRNRNKQKRGSSNKKPKKDEGCTESEAEGGRPQKGETVANNSVEVAKPDVLKPQPEVKEPETSAAAEMNKNGTVGGKLNKRSHKKQKREAGNKKPKKDEGCTESEAEGGRPHKGETVTNNCVEVAKPDVLKPQPDLKEPETSEAAEMDKNGTVGGKLNKREQETQKQGAGDKKPEKDEGCTENDAEAGRPQKGETVTNNSVEVPKPDVLKPQPEVKEPETSAAAEMNKNGTVRGKLNKRNQKNQKRVAGDKKPEKDEVCTENDAEAGRPQIGAEIPKPDILKSQPEVKEPQTSAGKPMPDLSAQKTNQTARKKRKAVEESSMSFEVDGADAAVDKTDTDESYKRKPQVSYAEKRGNSDSVIPPTKMTKSGCEVESDVNTKQTAEDNTSLEPAEKGKAKESENSGNNNIFSGKNKESEGCDRNGEDAALSSKMSEVENGHNKADENRNTLEIPDPEFNVFEDEREPENFAVNQVWSTCDSRDGMPRRYARVRKVLSSDFKLRVTYLKPVQENNDESIPVTWGKFNNGETKDVENRSIFSGQMLHSVCNRVVSIYPRKGEIWAMFSDWDEESSTLKNHELPYKYDFVEIVNDFKEEAGIGAAYLGKVKGFVSLFQREAKNTVCQVQFAPERMLRFSHKVPAVKMTGMEKEGVPAGSFELDPTALPKDIFQAEAVNVEMDSETMKGKADSPDPEAPETEVNAKPVPEIVPSPPRKRQKSDDDGGCSNRDKVCSTSVSIGKGEATKANDSSSSQVSKKSTPNGSRKSGEASDAFKLRKSPRLQTTPSQQIEEKKSAKQGDKINPPKTTDKVLATDSLGINKSSKGIQQQVERQVGEGSKKRGRDGELPSSSKQNDLPAQLDGSTNRSLETTPASSSCKTPQRNAFDFNNERSVDKFRRDQIWAIYSDDKGMPTEYVKVKKVETKPEVVLHVAHMELCPPSTEPVNRPVSCGEFKMETGKPKTLPLTSFSHRVKPFDSKQKIVKVYPRKGDIWALRKSCDSTEAEHDIVEVVEGYCEGKSIKAMALTAKGFSSIYTRKHGSHVSSLVVPKAEMSRFSHQIPAVKQEKRATRVAEGGYWELDPAAIPPPTTIVID